MFCLFSKNNQHEYSMDKIRALKYFLKVAETSSFSKAAKHFSVPASSVSRRIRDLEMELEVELFHRSTRVVKLSGLGEVYYDQVRDIIQSLENADDLVSQRSNSPTGLLRISVMPGYGRMCLYPILDKFHQLYPNIILDIELTNQLADITQNEVDIAIRGTAALPDRAVAKKLCENEFVIVASPSYLAEHGTPRQWEDILEHQTLLYRGPNGPRYWQANTENGWREIESKPTCISNDGIWLLNETKRGEGLCLLPRWGLHTDLANGTLIEVPLTNAKVSVARSLQGGIYLLYLRPRYRIAKIKAAVDFLISELTQP
jgi:DNA-binding transcriptional LysR family regulator